MQVVRTVADLRTARRSLTGRVGFVPTMGALHAGHLRLMEVAARKSDHPVVSIFVNPLQFGPNEDLAKYPRTEEDDLALCEKAGVALVFLPKPTEVYPESPLVRLTVDPALSGILCGAHRPGHFDGVAQVVAKLFSLVKPDLACFGEKDYQQLAVIRRLVADLSFDIDLVPVETVRDADGLALSSRNRYLSSEQRAVAPLLYQAFRQARQRAEQVRFDRIALPVERVEQASRDFLAAKAPSMEVEYLEIRHTDTLEPTRFVMNRSRIFGAVRLGATRLIDNLLLLD